MLLVQQPNHPVFGDEQDRDGRTDEPPDEREVVSKRVQVDLGPRARGFHPREDSDGGAGNNAVRAAVGKEPLVLPSRTAIGDYIAYTGKLMATEEGLREVCTMAHGSYFERLKTLGLYEADQKAVNRRIGDLGLTGILAQPVT